jgi:cytochrome c556
MMRGRIAAVVLGGIAAAVVGAAGVAIAKDASLKQVMGENFVGLQNILVGLITSNYGAVPAQVETIYDHATELTKNVPDVAKGDRDRFLGYAFSLQGHAADLKSIVEVLIKHDKASGGTDLPTDQLREAAAAHYGGMVTTCVACHNRFRRRVIQ